MAVGGDDPLVDPPGNSDGDVVVIVEYRCEPGVLTLLSSGSRVREVRRPRRADHRCGHDAHGWPVEPVGSTGPAWCRPQSGQRGSRVTGVQKMVVRRSSTAASAIVIPNSMVRMIVSATTDGGHAVASDNGSPRMWWWASVGTRIVTHRGPTSAHRHDTIQQKSADHRCSPIHEEPVIAGCASASSPVLQRDR